MFWYFLHLLNTLIDRWRNYISIVKCYIKLKLWRTITNTFFWNDEQTSLAWSCRLTSLSLSGWFSSLSSSSSSSLLGATAPSMNDMRSKYQRVVRHPSSPLSLAALICEQSIRMWPQLDRSGPLLWYFSDDHSVIFTDLIWHLFFINWKLATKVFFLFYLLN